MTPEQVDAVETSIASVALDEIADRFYAHLFALDPSARSLFPDDDATLRATFGAELAAIAMAIRHHDDFLDRVHRLAAVHRRRGVRTVHVRNGGTALAAAFADVLGRAWTPELATAWSLAYQLTTEVMLAAMAAAPRTAVSSDPPSRRATDRARRGS